MKPLLVTAAALVTLVAVAATSNQPAQVRAYTPQQVATVECLHLLKKGCDLRAVAAEAPATLRVTDADKPLTPFNTTGRIVGVETVQGGEDNTAVTLQPANRVQ